MSDHPETLPAFHALAWTRLVRGVADRHAAARHPTLATAGPDGAPELRTVVLRAADPQAGTLEIHTDLRSPKAAQIAADPRVALHVWDDRARLQIRIAANVVILTGEEVASQWGRVPAASRISYGSDPAPGQPIPAALDYRPGTDPAAFAVLRLGIARMDLLHLGTSHRRAVFARADDWTGHWLAP
ncbi:MAG: pyridoxamine 5'-phosphate oxidase family protein [Rubellimicrobium sp.]|nr:pyridoxamine 5'-phosphate oxidase family protein [Rubellimicrobium sp.]